MLTSKRLNEAQYRESIRESRGSVSFKRPMRPRHWVTWNTQSSSIDCHHSS